MEQNHGVVSIHWGSRDHLYQPLHIADELAETRDFLVSCWRITQISRYTCAPSKFAGLSRSSLPECSDCLFATSKCSSGFSELQLTPHPVGSLRMTDCITLGKSSWGYTNGLYPITSLVTLLVMVHPLLPWYNIWWCDILWYTYLSTYCLCKLHRTGTLSYSLHAYTLSSRKTRKIL